MLSLLELWAVVLYPTPLCCMNSYLGSLSLTQSSLILQQPPQRLYGQLTAGWGCRLCLSRGHMHIGLRLQTNHVVFWYLICCQWGFYVDIVQGIGLPTFIIHNNLDLICWVFRVSSHSSPIALALKCCHNMSVEVPASDKWWGLDFPGCGLASAWNVELVSCINHLDVQHKVDGSEVFMMVCPSGEPA